jgi:hypothetical protein
MAIALPLQTPRFVDGYLAVFSLQPQGQVYCPRYVNSSPTSARYRRLDRAVFRTAFPYVGRVRSGGWNAVASKLDPAR